MSIERVDIRRVAVEGAPGPDDPLKTVGSPARSSGSVNGAGDTEGRMRDLLIGIGVMVLGGIMVGLLFVPLFPDHSPGQLWVAGAAALGFLGGFTAGYSKAEGSGKAFMTLIGTGIFVPLLGGVGALFDRTQTVTEISTYSGTTLIEKTTKTAVSPSDPSLHPIAVLGSFFLGFAALAILGEIAGALVRKSNLAGNIPLTNQLGSK